MEQQTPYISKEEEQAAVGVEDKKRECAAALVETEGKPPLVLLPEDETYMSMLCKCQFCKKGAEIKKFRPCDDQLRWAVCGSDLCMQSMHQSYAAFLETNPMNCMEWMFRTLRMKPSFAHKRSNILRVVDSFAPFLEFLTSPPYGVDITFNDGCTTKRVSIYNIIRSTFDSQLHNWTENIDRCIDILRGLDAHTCDECIPSNIPDDWRLRSLKDDPTRKGVLNSISTFITVLERYRHYRVSYVRIYE